MAAKDKPIKCAGCGREIADVNSGSSKNINGKWFCSAQCHKRHAQ